jgi:hypothetical protein
LLLLLPGLPWVRLLLATCRLPRRRRASPRLFPTRGFACRLCVRAATSLRATSGLHLRLGRLECLPKCLVLKPQHLLFLVVKLAPERLILGAESLLLVRLH